MENFGEINMEMSESEDERLYREMREEFATKVLEGNEVPNNEFLKKMKDAAKELGTRADMIDRDVARKHMTPEEQAVSDNRESELRDTLS
ncbi:MAG: hypothetical protein Q7S28_02310 [bacterium]|nr:hypothetical protein [bacterium]